MLVVVATINRSSRFPYTLFFVRSTAPGQPPFLALSTMTAITNHRMMVRLRCTLFLFLFVAMCLTTRPVAGSPARPPFVLRLRLPNGSIQKVGLDEEKIDETSLENVLKGIPQAAGLEAQIGSTTVDDLQQSLAALGLQRGSLITLRSPEQVCQDKRSSGLQKKKAPSSSSTTTTSQSSRGKDRWDPYPDLAKNYRHAKRQARRKSSALSYSDLARLQSELHVVEAQPEGSVQRLYMCRKAAEAVATAAASASSNNAAATAATPQAALLLGTVARERKDLQVKRKPKTSLSSTTQDEEYCMAAKVHALWQPRSSSKDANGSGSDKNNQTYDSASLLDLSSSPQARHMLQVAAWLGLQPVGWIFTHADDGNRHDHDGLPVLGPDVQTAGALQIDNMQRFGREEGSRFVTLAMDGATGATEAFQLSDVAVQMVAEQVFVATTTNNNDNNDDNDAGAGAAGRFMETSIPVVVDGKETHKVDSVLCLVNTALLSHEGLYVANGNASVVKKTGGFTKKVKKRLSAALLANDDASLLEMLSNFNLLVALTERLLADPGVAESLVKTVRKFSRGQRRGTRLDLELKQKIGLIVDS